MTDRSLKGKTAAEQPAAENKPQAAGADSSAADAETAAKLAAANEQVAKLNAQAAELEKRAAAAEDETEKAKLLAGAAEAKRIAAELKAGMSGVTPAHNPPAGKGGPITAIIVGAGIVLAGIFSLLRR